MKSISAIVAAAFVAAIVAVMTGSSAQVSAGPMPQAESEQMHACADRPWPYLRCVGTRYGNPKIRLVMTDSLSAK